MNTPATDIQTSDTSTIYPSSAAENEVFYPAELIDDMGETAIHFKFTALLLTLLHAFLISRNDAVVAANMMVYYEKGDTKKCLVPDVFVCFGVENKLRRVFKTWEEGVFPQVVFEIASEGTFENDLGGKRLDYARLGVEEYYLIDPEREYLPAPLMAFHRQNGRLLSADVDKSRVFSPLLGLEIVDTGKSFRLFDPQKREFLQAVLTGEE